SICTSQVLSLELYASYRRIQSLGFFGLGPSSAPTRYEFKEDEAYGGGVVRLPLWDWLRVEGQVENRLPSLRSSTDPFSVKLNFTETSAPGLSTQPDFMHYSTAVRTAGRRIAERASGSTRTPPGSGEPLMKARLTYQFQNIGSYHWFKDLDSG